MSEETREAVDLPTMGDAAFGALMDALVPEEGTAAVGDGATPPAADAPAKPDAADGSNGTDGGSPDAPGQPAESSSTPAAQAPAVAGGTAEGGAEQPAAAGQPADLPATWTASSDEYLPKLGELSVKLEDAITTQLRKQAFDATRNEYENYFQALETHPRLLVGTQVPAIGKEGMETLKDSQDAKEWQEAVRELLIQEVDDGTRKLAETASGQIQMLHASIDLFKNNSDLIPGTRTFNKQLADEFAKIAEPYEVRQDGKLRGYSIPVQPIIDGLRAKMATPGNVQEPNQSSASKPPGAGVNPPAADPPQAGIPSKAGASSEREDFSALFGTIGLPNLQI
jgi:hypothetical protein